MPTDQPKQEMQYFVAEFSHGSSSWTCALGWDSEEDGHVAYCAEGETPAAALVAVLAQALEYGELVPESS